MKKSGFVLAATACSLLFLLSAPLLADDADPQRLIRQLGAARFHERQEAERQLKDQSRAALGALRDALNGTDEPEVRMRLKRIIEHLISDVSKIPQGYWALNATQSGAYDQLAKDFRDRSSTSAANTAGESGTSGAFAQSFIPRCRTISSIEVCTYPLSDAFGWMRLDLCSDRNGVPGNVLARSWVRIPKDHAFPPCEYVYHDIPDQPVDPTGVYWLVYVDFPDRGSNATLINYGLSFNRDDYPDGMLWRSPEDAPKRTEDVKFRVFSSNPDVHPAYRKATEEEIKTVSPEQQAKNWHLRGKRVER